jgi:predicted nucleic acid-binding protein
MAETGVVNASPLIYLSRAGWLELLRLAGDEVFVPDVVADEIRARGPADPTVMALAATAWLTAVKTPPISPAILAWDLGPGESSVLAFAQARPGCRAVIDDLQGRRCAEALGVPLRGTLGLVLRAKRDGIVPAARPVLDRLRAAGMFLSDAVLNRALATIGE